MQCVVSQRATTTKACCKHTAVSRFLGVELLLCVHRTRCLTAAFVTPFHCLAAMPSARVLQVSLSLLLLQVVAAKGGQGADAR